MPYYGDTPGQASALELQDVASQRQYLLGLAQQQLAARNADQDAALRNRMFQQGLVDSAAARAQHADEFAKTFGLQQQQLQGALDQTRGAKAEADNNQWFGTVAQMVQAGKAPTSTELADLVGDNLSSAQYNKLQSMNQLAHAELTKNAARAEEYAAGLNERIKPQLTQYNDLDKQYQALLANPPKTSWWSSNTDQLTALKKRREEAQTALTTLHTAVSKELEKNHLDSVIGLSPSGLFQSTVKAPGPYNTAPAARGLRAPTRNAPSARQLGVAPTAPDPTPAPTLDNEEGGHGSEAAAPAAAPAPAPAPTYVSVLHNLLVQADKSAAVESALLQVRAQYAHDPAKQAVEINKLKAKWLADRTLVQTPSAPGLQAPPRDVEAAVVRNLMSRNPTNGVTGLSDPAFIQGLNAWQSRLHSAPVQTDSF